MRTQTLQSKPKAARTNGRKAATRHVTADEFYSSGADGLNQAMGERRWASAQTNRLNRAHWESRPQTTLNLDLNSYLALLRERCETEAANNGFVEGVINTHTVDLVGNDGPKLQVRSSSKRFNARLEQIWADWWASPDASGILAGPDLLRQWLRLMWTNGEFFVQLITDKTADGIKLRLLQIPPRRVLTPYNMIANQTIVMGVDRNEYGKPTRYFVQDELPGIYAIQMMVFAEVPARYMIHGFDVREPLQARGVPWLAPVLQDVADLRDYDDQVMDAARAAADQSVLLESNHIDITPVTISADTSTPIQRRTMRHIPAGWTAKQMAPEQPSTNYREYRKERLRSIGRPVSMPLMTIMLDASDHSYASARLDDQKYNRSNASIRGFFERKALSRVLSELMTEAALLGKLPNRPDDFHVDWVWPKAPHVDPVKEAEADDIKLKNGTMTLEQSAAADGGDWEELIAQRKREKEALQEAGLWVDPAPPKPPDPDTGAAIKKAVEKGAADNAGAK